ncbi:MAG: TolC family protein, partial [Leadbetterella sp.]|nr:TolC family protein [Leadbetterella sp.]
PGLYTARRNYFAEQLEAATLNTEVLGAVIRKEVRQAYYQLWYLEDKKRLFVRLDSLYTGLFQAAEIRLRSGDAALLDKLAAEVKLKESKALLEQITGEMDIQQKQLMLLLNVEERLLPADEPLHKREPGQPGVMTHPLLSVQEQNVRIASSNMAVQKQSNRPEFSGRFFTQRLWGAPDPFTGFSVSVSIPVFGKEAYKSRSNVARSEKKVQEETLEFRTRQLETEKAAAITEIEKNRSLLHFYETSGLNQADMLIRTATLSYRSGEISFAELSQYLSQAIGIRQNYLDVLNLYNQSVIQFNYLNNN